MESPVRRASRRGSRRQRRAERGGAGSQPCEGFRRERPDPGGEGDAGGTGPRVLQAPPPSREARASPPPSPLSARVPALLFLPSSPLSVSASLPLPIVPHSHPQMLASAPLWDPAPGAPLHPPCPLLGTSHRSARSSYPSTSPPSSGSLQPPLHFSVVGSPTHSALRASLGSPLLAAQPRSSRRDPGARAFPPRAAVVRRSPGPGGNPTPQVEGKMGRLGPVQLGPMSTRRRVPSAFPRDRELPGHHCRDCPR